MRVGFIITCVSLLLGSCLLGDADGEAPPPASAAQTAAIVFNPDVSVDEDGNADGPLLLPRTTGPRPAAAGEDVGNFDFDADAFMSGDLPVRRGRIDGPMGERTFTGETVQNRGWFTAWDDSVRAEGYLTLEVAANEDGGPGAGMLILGVEGPLDDIMLAIDGADDFARRLPTGLSTWVAGCWGPEMNTWDNDVGADHPEVLVREDPEDPDNVLFEITAAFDGGDPVEGEIDINRGAVTSMLVD
ncbi:MAG: hypothetical protein PVI30_03725 [Myxococcales bacterium]|jgi:hypothetical protein